ncbi:hypothetical protein [Allokutzneria sp. NRRL B-24872]|uniref:hypothetical protein n=1 Tax=Allokutzneria sp. NRRL B-24872 TaxID=1137961 RepID=UPI001177F87B|nr:hypothetical protein [Allokutzneria sp. NRRL B-24872]
MVLGRDAELEQQGARAALTIGDHNGSGGASRTTLSLRDSGELVLYSADSGWAVMMQLGEHVQEWRRWHTVASGDVGRLDVAAGVDEAAAFLEAVRDALGVRQDQPGTSIEMAFASWLRGQGVPFGTREVEDW